MKEEQERAFTLHQDIQLQPEVAASAAAQLERARSYLKVAAPVVNISSKGTNWDSAQILRRLPSLLKSREVQIRSKRHVLDHSTAHPTESPPTAVEKHRQTAALSATRRHRRRDGPSPQHPLPAFFLIFFYFQKYTARGDGVAAEGCGARRQAAGRLPGCPQRICSLPQDLHLTSISPLLRHLYLSFQETSDDSHIGTSDEANVTSKMNST